MRILVVLALLVYGPVLAQDDAPDRVAMLLRLLGGDDPDLSQAAAREILDIGRPAMYDIYTQYLAGSRAPGLRRVERGRAEEGESRRTCSMSCVAPRKTPAKEWLDTRDTAGDSWSFGRPVPLGRPRG